MQTKRTKREIRKLVKAVKAAELRINARIRNRMFELKNDEILVQKIDSELKEIKGKEDLNKYIKDAYARSKSDAQAG